VEGTCGQMLLLVGRKNYETFFLNYRFDVGLGIIRN
jgi:hypothetical protein